MKHRTDAIIHALSIVMISLAISASVVAMGRWALDTYKYSTRPEAVEVIPGGVPVCVKCHVSRQGPAVATSRSLFPKLPRGANSGGALLKAGME